MNGTQLTLAPWTHADHVERERLIAKLPLPRSLTVSSRSVSATVCRALLYRLNSHAQGLDWCDPTLAQLAGETGHSEKTLRRAVEALMRLGVLDKRLRADERTRVVRNEYRVDWLAISGRCRPAQHPETAGTDRTPGTRSDTVSDCCETDRSDTRPLPIGHTAPTDRTPGPPTCNVDGVNNTPAPPVNRAGSDGAGVLKIRWGRKIAPAELHDPPRLLPELHAAAVAAGACQDTEADRLAFASLFAYALRQRQSANRFGLFTALLTGRHRDRFTTSRDWRTRPTQFDEEQARRWLRAIEAEDPLAARGEARSTQPDPEAAARHQAERDHADALRRFALAMQDGRWSAGRRQEAAQP